MEKFEIAKETKEFRIEGKYSKEEGFEIVRVLFMPSFFKEEENEI